MTTPASRSLGRYELLFLLGQGGMGEVHLAKLTGAAGFEKLCIVKTVLPNLMSDPQFIDRFHHEARVLVQLTHSNIAQVYDMGEVEGTLYMAIEYVPGVDLSRVETRVQRQQAQMPLQTSVYIGQQITEALGYAHRKAGADGMPLGIVHRDVSPQNVMVSYEGEVKVIDFGLAKSSARSKHTLPATVMGKLGYMSPEQALARTVDHRSDIFSAGIVVWEMIAGRPLYQGGTMPEMVAQMAMGEVPSLRAARPDISDTLEQVVMRALAKDPAARYQRADDFARALNELAVREGLTASAEDVGNYVRAMCPEEFAAERQLQSKLSMMRKKGSGGFEVATPPPSDPGFEGTFLKPSQPGVPSPQTASGQFMTAAQRAMSVVQPSKAPAPAPAQAAPSGSVPGAAAPDPSLSVPRSKAPLVVVGLLAAIAVAGGALVVLGHGEKETPRPEPEVTKPKDPVPVVEVPAVDAGPAVAVVEPPVEKPTEPIEPPVPSETTVPDGPVWKVTRKGDDAFIVLGKKDKVREGDRINLVGEPLADGKTRPVYAHGAVMEIKGALAKLLVDDGTPLPEKLYASRDASPKPVARPKEPRAAAAIASADPAAKPDGRTEPGQGELKPVEPKPAEVKPAEAEVKPAEVKPAAAATQLFGTVRIGTPNALGNRPVFIRNNNAFPLSNCELRLPSNMVFRFGARTIARADEVKIGFRDFRTDSRPADPQFKADWAAMYCREGTGYWKTSYDRR